MAKRSEFEPASITRRLAIFIVAFYGAYYLVGLCAYAASEVAIGAPALLLPFDWIDFSPVGSAIGRGARARARVR